MAKWNKELVKKVLNRGLLNSPEIHIRTLSRNGERWTVCTDAIDKHNEGHIIIDFTELDFQMSLRTNKGTEEFPRILYADIESLFTFTAEQAAEIQTFKFLGKPKLLRNERIYIG